MMIMSSGALLTREAGEGPVEADYNTFGFDGIDDYIELTSDPSLTLGDGDKTHLVWFKTSSSTRQMMFSSGDPVNGPYYEIAVHTGGAVRAYAQANASDTRAYDTNLTFNDNLLHCLVVRWNSYGVFDIDIDGISQSLTAVATDVITNVADGGVTRIGNRDYTTTLEFNGSLTYPIIWDRTLTNTEVSNLYNSGKTPYYETLPASLKSGNVLALELSSRDATANDLSGNGNNGTKNGGISADGSLQTFASYS